MPIPTVGVPTMAAGKAVAGQIAIF